VIPTVTGTSPACLLCKNDDRKRQEKELRSRTDSNGGVPVGDDVAVPIRVSSAGRPLQPAQDCRLVHMMVWYPQWRLGYAHRSTGLNDDDGRSNIPFRSDALGGRWCLLCRVDALNSRSSQWSRHRRWRWQLPRRPQLKIVILLVGDSDMEVNDGVILYILTFHHK